MPWGKYKGDLIADVPSSYVVWLLDNGKVDDPHLAHELAVELRRRLEEYLLTRDPGFVGDREAGEFHPPDNGPRPTPVTATTPRADLALQVVESGFRAVAHKLHPDRGGDAERMKELNSVRDALRKAVNKL